MQHSECKDNASIWSDIFRKEEQCRAVPVCSMGERYIRSDVKDGKGKAGWYLFTDVRCKLWSESRLEM